MDATREVFGNIGPAGQRFFYLIIFGSLAVNAWQLTRRVRIWRRGTSGEWERDWRIWLQRLGAHALAQTRVRRRKLAGSLHVLLFSGFAVLTLGTTLLFIADKGPVNFHRGLYFLLYELAMDVFGVALCLGCVIAIGRRRFARPQSLGHTRRDWFLLLLLFAIGLTGFAIEGLRLAYTNPDPSVARWSPVGYGLSLLFSNNLDLNVARYLHLGVWWLHTLLIVVFFATAPTTRLLHALTATLNLMLRPSRPAGALAPVTMESVEQTGRIGISAIGHFTQQQLLSFDSCMECGRCQDVCPAYATDKPLNPKSLIMDLRDAMPSNATDNLHGKTVAAETLWACTMCQACVFECPVLIGHVDVISDLRRHLVGEGQLSGPPAQALRRIGNQGNPHGQPASDRLVWAEGLEVPTVSDHPNFEVLLWVGCAAAFDPRAQRVARATVQLFREAGVSFAVLGHDEQCTGDPARRLGDEFLFQAKAQANVATLQAARVSKIVTPCPHCMNTLKHEYRQFGGDFEVVHHSQFLAELLENGKLQRSPRTSGSTPLTLHDPCYLARVNEETQAQRAVLNAVGELVELPRHGARTFCCGAGGGRMWFDEPPEQRVSRVRAEEVVASGARTVATACPFCLNMLSDGLAGVAGGEQVRALDIAELLADGIPT